MTETPTPPTSLGDWLAERRVELGLDLDSAARTTRIRKVFLQALEQNDFASLPGKAYVSGFLKNYAELLGLDPAQALARYQAQIAPSSQAAPAAATPPTAPRQAAQPSRNGYHWLGPLVALIAVLALVGYWIGVQAPQSRPVLTPPAPQASVPEPVEPQLTNTAADAATPTSDAVSPIEPGAAAEQATAAPRAEPQPAPPVAPVETASPPTPVPQVAAPLNEPTEQPQQFAVLPPGVAIMTLSARAATRLSVEVDNRPAQSYDLSQDSELSWPVRRRARLQLSDPSAVSLSLAGAPLDLQGARDVLLLPRRAD